MMIPFSELTKMDPPTWKADEDDPEPSAYRNHSVGYWAKAGNLVWFSITFAFDRLVVTSTIGGFGDYYWNPTFDGAPGIDPDIYNNSKDQAMLCGRSRVITSGFPPFREINGICEIEASSVRIYPSRSGGKYRYGPQIGPRDKLLMSGMYVTKI